MDIMDSSSIANLAKTLVGFTDEQMKAFLGACFDEGGKAFAQRLNVQVKEATAEKFDKKRQAEDESVVASVTKQAKVNPKRADAQFSQVVKYAGNLKFTMAVDYPAAKDDETPPMLVGKVTRDLSLDYNLGVKQMIQQMDHWEKLGHRCQGNVVAHRIALALLSSEYEGGVKQFREAFGIPRSTMTFYRTGAFRMARLALEVSPGLWSCPAVVKAWDDLSRINKTTFEKHLDTLKNCVVLGSLENDSVRDHLDGIRTYAEASFKLLSKTMGPE